MIIIGAIMLIPRRGVGHPEVRLTTASARALMPPLIALGLLAGGASGFFGIGGGFLIVPALILATDMPVEMAVGSSLVAVATFGLPTAVSYGSAGLVDWPLALLFIVGGSAGGLLGARLATRLAARKNTLTHTFAAIVIGMGAYVAASRDVAPARSGAAGRLWEAQPAVTLASPK